MLDVAALLPRIATSAIGARDVALYDDLHYRIRRIEAPPRPALVESAPQTAPQPRARAIEVVDVRSLVVREAPGERARVVASLRRGKRVEVTERSGDWERVAVDGFDAGWVAGRFTQPSPRSLGASQRRQKPPGRRSPGERPSRWPGRRGAARRGPSRRAQRPIAVATSVGTHEPVVAEDARAVERPEPRRGAEAARRSLPRRAQAGLLSAAAERRRVKC
jgi:hypothetical protein